MTTPRHKTEWNGPVRAGFAGLLLAWFATAYVIGTEQLLPNEGSALIAPIAMTAAIPVAVFLALYALSSRFRGFILAQDIRALTMLQHWRVMGFAFLPLTFFGVLPGLFAWPAGLGDIAIGLAAPFVIARIGRDPAWATSAGLVRYHLLGLLDFAVAIATAGLSAGAFPNLIADGVASAPMDVWPLNLFPSFLVPIFIILHLSVLLKVRHLRRVARHRVELAVGTA
ncbi:MAG: hypothetical protein ACE5GS_16245 [Kiloniellaceae bacterium]